MKPKERISAVRQKDVFELEDISVFLSVQVYGLGLVWDFVQNEAVRGDLPNEVFHLMSQFYDAIRDAAKDLENLQIRFGNVFLDDDNMLLGPPDSLDEGADK